MSLCFAGIVLSLWLKRIRFYGLYTFFFCRYSSISLSRKNIKLCHYGQSQITSVATARNFLSLRPESNHFCRYGQKNSIATARIKLQISVHHSLPSTWTRVPFALRRTPENSHESETKVFVETRVNSPKSPIGVSNHRVEEKIARV